MATTIGILICAMLAVRCQDAEDYHVEVFETSAAGHKLTPVPLAETTEASAHLRIRTDNKRQLITGFGGSFTEASAHLLHRMSPAKQEELIEAYFGESGARYSLTRTHINSCDFSLTNYAYVADTADLSLNSFSIQKDEDDIIPMIHAAQNASKEGFKIISSPWTAPPWMKDNNSYVGGKLLKAYYPVWAQYFTKYIDAYRERGIPIWGLTVENEPLGNGNNWESMHFTPEEMSDFVQNHLGPTLEEEGKSEVVLLGYDQNRKAIPEWADDMYVASLSKNYYDGMAIHWYESTVNYFPDELEYAHAKAPGKYLIQTEACVDAEVPHWQDDAWYWKPEATDWGWDWAPEEDKHLHPKYRPAYRYARDIIGCLNHWVDGWVDWNMILDRQGGPNWFKNWCIAPVIVDPEADEIYYTPLYYIMSHFSRYIRPGAQVVGVDLEDQSLMASAAINPDGSTIVLLFNPEERSRTVRLSLTEKDLYVNLSAQALQTISITKTK